MNEIIWYQLPNESPDERALRLNKDLHRIFFDGKDVCPENNIEDCFDKDALCLICGVDLVRCTLMYHGAPRFLESLDAMQLIVESGRFAEVREEFFHWLPSAKEKYECTILLYGKQLDLIRFTGKGDSRQEAFCRAALASQGYTVVKEKQGRP